MKIHIRIIFSFFPGMDRRPGGHMNANGNGYNGNNNVERANYSDSRASRFSAKRSRSPSPPRSNYGKPSRFDSRESSGTHDYKRPRTDNSRPPHEESRHSYSSTSNGHSHPPPPSSTVSNSYNAFYKQMTSYLPPPIPTMYPAAYQMHAQSQQPPLPSGPPPS